MKTYYDSDEDLSSCSNEDSSLDVVEMLRDITDNFNLTYKQVSKNKQFKEAPLNGYESEELQRIIVVQRQKAKRIKKAKAKNALKSDSIQISGQKRNYTAEENINEDSIALKRPKIERLDETNKVTTQYRHFSKYLIQQFEKLDPRYQNKVLDSISNLMIEDTSLLQNCVHHQAKSLADTYLKLFENKNFDEIQRKLSTISPFIAIIINIEISTKLSNYPEEGISLSQTLLPFINQCTTYDFITQENNALASRFAHTLILYFSDSDIKIKKGFAAYCLEFAPSALQKIMNNEQNKLSLTQALTDLGYNKDCSEAMPDFHEKFLWPELLNALSKMGKEEKENMVALIQRLIIIQDPGLQIKELKTILVVREIFMKCLLKKETINMTIPKLITVLNAIQNMPSDSIREILKEESQIWEVQVQKLMNKDVVGEDTLDQQVIESLFKDRTQKLALEQIISLEVFTEYSMELQEQCPNYTHCLYQCAVAAIAASQKFNARVVEMPTGSGKTWIYALLAKHYLKIGKKVTIIEPNSQLCEQTAQMLESISFDLSFITIDQFYQHPTEDQVLIINEYHHIVQHSSFTIANGGLAGLWMMQNRITFFCSATSSRPLERLLDKVVCTPSVLTFPSEYELIHKVSSIDGGQIKCCETRDTMIQMLEDDIVYNLDERPIIIIAADDELGKIEGILKKIKVNKYKIGTDAEVLREIRQWRQGVLILKKHEGMGINTRFSQDSIVLIVCQVDNIAQYHQFIGRSSRTRGLCLGIYYAVTKQSSFQVMENFKSSDRTLLTELAYLLKFLSYKHQVQILVNAISDSFKDGEKIISMKDVQSILKPSDYEKLSKNFKF